jgi:hypothetical protein
MYRHSMRPSTISRKSSNTSTTVPHPGRNTTGRLQAGEGGTWWMARMRPPATGMYASLVQGESRKRAGVEEAEVK